MALKREIIILTVLYTLAHGLTLLNAGVFWDDWAAVHQSFHVVWNYWFDPVGYRIVGKELAWFFTLGSASIFLARLATFLAYLVSSVMFLLILRHLKCPPAPRLLCVLFFALWPATETRIMVLWFFWAFYYLLFWVAACLALLWLKHKRFNLIRVLCLILFFISFELSSLLVLYGLFFLILAYLCIQGRSPKDWIRQFVKILDFMALPFIYWEARKLFLTPIGLFVGYNNPDLSIGVRKVFNGLMQSARASFTEPLWEMFHSSGWAYWTTLIFAAVGIFWFLHRSYRADASCVDRKFDEEARLAWSRDGIFMVGGLVAWIFAVMPYILVNKAPSNESYASRAEVLIPAGVALLIVFSLRMLSALSRLPKKYEIALFSILIAGSLTANIRRNEVWFRDWFKQEGIMVHLSQSEVVKAHTSFEWDDHMKSWQAAHRIYQFHELSGMMRRVFRDSTRFVNDGRMSLREFMKDLEPLRSSPQFNIENYQPIEQQFRIVVYPTGKAPSSWKTISLAIMGIVSPERFREEVASYMRIELLPL